VPILLRIDVDNPFGWSSTYKKFLNYISINFRKVPIRYNYLGYLKDSRSLFNTLNDAGVKGTWFFRVQTRPRHQFRAELSKNGHEIAYHAERTASKKDFQEDLEILSRKFKEKILGFSKHGSGTIKLSRYHNPEYEVETLLKLGIESDLKYFSGNGLDPSLSPFKYKEMIGYRKKLSK